MLFDDEWKPYVWLTYYKPPRDYWEVKFTIELASYSKGIVEFILSRLGYSIREKEINPRPLDENLVLAFLEWRCSVDILALQGLWVNMV